jgi:hypothetical protein
VWLDCAVIGDSIGAATHTDDACVSDPDGRSTELMDCLESQLGSHDPNWSFMGGSKSWAIANRVCCRNAYNTSEDGEQWKDALDQAMVQIQTGQIGKVVVNLGSNDVCAKYGHDYGSLAFVQPSTPAGVLSIEAEHDIQRFSGNTHRWRPHNDAEAAITAVRAMPNSGTVMGYPEYLTDSPRLDFRIHFVRAGTHYVWIRGNANGRRDDVIHVGLNGQRQSNAENIKIRNYDIWTWTGSTETGQTAVIDIPSAGSHTLNVYMAEDGFRMDKIVLTADGNWVPLTSQPPEGARGIIKQEDQSGDALVSVETEHYHQLHNVGSHNWHPDFKAGYSGGAALIALPDTGAQYDDITSAPRLDYNVNFKSAGTYYVWVRGYATAKSNDSVSVGVDGTSYGMAERITFNSYNTWTWSNRTASEAAATIDIASGGIHTVNIWMHKDGLRLDKVVMTKSSGFQPSGSGPQEQWENDLGRIAGHIDDTMLYLTEHLPAMGMIYWSGIADISKFRDMMMNRKHDHVFKKCQYLWDLDLDQETLQGDAISSLCIGELGYICELLPDILKTNLLDLYLSEFQEDFNGDKPCGRLLDSRNTQADRDEVRRFNKSLNDLMEQKADQFHKRNGVDINFTQALWYNTGQMRPYFISHLDCYHPSRAGQMKLAQMVWQGHNPKFTPTDVFFFEGFDSDDECTQEYTAWESCWEDGGGGACGDEFICSIDNSGWFKFGKETSEDKEHWIGRKAGDLSDKSEVWAYFKHKRDYFGFMDSDWVAFYVYDGSSWDNIEKFRQYSDAGNHCSRYYDLTAFKNVNPLEIRFRTNDSTWMRDGDKLMLDDISIFAW